MDLNRNVVLGVLLGVFGLLTYLVLAAVLQVVVFAVTVAYVLYPIQQWLRRRGFSRRVATVLVTVAAFLAVVALVAPILFAIYNRRELLITELSAVPELITVEVASFSYTVAAGTVKSTALQVAQDLAVDLAVVLPQTLLALVLFTFVLYGILYKPGSVGDAIFGVVPPEYHDIVLRLHERARNTLYAIYIIQAATAVGTFFISLVVFVALGYPTPIWLAVTAGILQFIPILGPSILIIGLAGADLVIFEMPIRAVVVLIVGLVVIGFLPDATIRPKLAGRTGSFSSTLYFVGFVGGLLTVGPIGFIVGPLVVALFVEVVDMVSEETSGHSRKETDHPE